VYVLSAFTNEPDYLNIGGALMRAQGGAVSVIGETSVQFEGSASFFMQAFFRQAYTLGAETVGEALTRAISGLSPRTPSGNWDEFRVTTQGNILLGDPALPVAGARDSRPAELPPGQVAQDETPAGRSWRVRATPNPASASMLIDVDPRAGVGAERFDVSVFDATGRRIRTLVHGTAPSGSVPVPWNLDDTSGERVREGLYFVRVSTSSESRTLRVIVLR